MDDQNKTAVQCPNCLKPAHKDGDDIVCVRCDATFTVKKTGAAKVRQIGRLESIEDRLGKAESKLADLLPDESTAEPAEDEPSAEPEPDETEDEILPR